MGWSYFRGGLNAGCHSTCEAGMLYNVSDIRKCSLKF